MSEATETVWEGRFIVVKKQGAWEYVARARGIQARAKRTMRKMIVSTISTANNSIRASGVPQPLENQPNFVSIAPGLIAARATTASAAAKA